MKKRRKRLVLWVAVLFFVSVALQFAYNLLMVKPYEPELTKGGDSGLTELLYESENLEDSWFADAAQVSAKLEGAIERIDVREDCADFTANAMIRFYLENEHRLAQENKDQIKACLTGFKYWMDQYDGRQGRGSQQASEGL